MFDFGRRMNEAGVLGVNRRNTEFIMKLNPRRLYPRVDDKVLTKKLALEAGMAVPELYGLISSQSEIRNLPQILENRASFVIKPARGSGGDGILVIAGQSYRRRGSYRLISGLLITESELRHHVSNVVGGQYSLSGNPDTALIEYCVKFDPMFAEVSYQGVPDIRVIVYRGYPIMAMVRLPTRTSDGKANLHKGAVGAGIDMGSGETLKGVLNNDVVDEHPDTGAPIAGLYIPHWDFILQGLNIQIANCTGLAHRLNRIDEIFDVYADPVSRARIARQEFAAERQTALPLNGTI
jgi:alpha-L-glutamate ligase-like protein